MNVRKFNAGLVPQPRNAPSLENPRSLPLDIEIGCGVGLHPIRYARENPDRLLVAIEHTRIKFDKFAGRLAHHDPLENLLAVHADAVEWITHRIAAGSVDRYFLLYPNPEPKRESSRWYAMPFMERIRETLKPGGLLTLATNEEYYAEGAQNYMLECWGFRLESRRALSKGFTHRTHFEKKYLERGETCWDLVFRR